MLPVVQQAIVIKTGAAMYMLASETDIMNIAAAKISQQVRTTYCSLFNEMADDRAWRAHGSFTMMPDIVDEKVWNVIFKHADKSFYSKKMSRTDDAT